MSESDSPQAIEPCELHARESQRLQPDRTPAEPSTRGEGTSHAECPYVTGKTTRYCTLTPFTLTDAEREALHWFAHYGLPEHRAATLRGLLERANYPAVSDSSGGTRSKEPEES